MKYFRLWAAGYTASDHTHLQNVRFEMNKAEKGTWKSLWLMFPRIGIETNDTEISIGIRMNICNQKSLVHLLNMLLYWKLLFAGTILW